MSGCCRWLNIQATDSSAAQACNDRQAAMAHPVFLPYGSIHGNASMINMASIPFAEHNAGHDNKLQGR